MGSLKTLTVQLKSDIKVEIAARKQLEKERSSLQRDLARQRDQLTQQVEDLRGSLGRDLRAERALRQRAEFGLQSATEERRTAEDRVTKMTLAQRDAVRQLEAEKVRGCACGFLGGIISRGYVGGACNHVCEMHNP